MRLRIMALGLLGVSSAVVAQQNNADYYNEQRNIQQQQFQQEQNRQGYQTAQDAVTARQIPPPPTRPTGEWIKTWGAISQSTNGPQGASVGKLSKIDAENEAIQLCIKGGGNGCKASFAYMNQCVAMSQSIREDGSSLIQGAESIEIATQLSMQKCENENGSACESIYSACSDPIFHSY